MSNFLGSNLVNISQLVKDQFPAFYKEHGPNFIAFIEAYYEWLEQEENPIGSSRSLYSKFDIDTTPTAFLNHFREKYMWGLPPELLGNQKLLQKHILELYRSKGSQQATKLLFRLLYNEDISFYIPSYDIFKLSDNTWVQPKYLEVSWSPHFDKLINSIITGTKSHSTAIVESYESRYVNGNVVHLLFISNIIGEFEVNESVTTEKVPHYEAPSILGSIVGAEIKSAPPTLGIGSTLTATTGDFPIRIIVSETTSGSGTLVFEIVEPGTYYSLDAVIDTPVMPIGGGAEIKVGSLKDPQGYFYVYDKVQPYTPLDLDGVWPFPKEPNSNLATIIDDSLISDTVVLGSIETITVLNPGNGYEDFVYFYPRDPYSTSSGQRDANGNYIGNNAVIVGTPVIGTQIPKSVRILSSGYNTFTENNIVFVSDDDPNIQMIVTPIIGPIGTDEGYYINTKSFLSDDKYLFDGHYYQDFSYVIKASSSLDKYLEILKLISHPIGNAVYGDVRISDVNRLYNDAITTRIVYEEFLYNNEGWNDDGIWMDEKVW